MAQTQFTGIVRPGTFATVRTHFMKTRSTLLSTFACLVLLVSSAPAAPLDKSVFSVREFGAAGDDKNLDSPAIDKAIQAASKAGGGTVYLSPGTYLSGTIHLADNIHLYIDMRSEERRVGKECR